MTQQEYLEHRVEDQIEWYDNKSVKSQQWFKRLQTISIFASASIPFLAGYITAGGLALRITVGALGVLVTGITATMGVFKFQENWLSYRTTCESLKHEKYLFLTGSDVYDGEAEPFKLLVERVESLISRENSAWMTYMKKEKEKEVPSSSSPS